MDFGPFSCHDCMKQYFVSTIPVFCIRKNIHPYQMGDDISLGCNTQRLSTQTGFPRHAQRIAYAKRMAHENQSFAPNLGSH